MAALALYHHGQIDAAIAAGGDGRVERAQAKRDLRDHRVTVTRKLYRQKSYTLAFTQAFARRMHQNPELQQRITEARGQRDAMEGTLKIKS